MPDDTRQPRPRPWRTLAALTLAALALRLLVFAAVAHEPRKFYTYDSDGYDRRAMNILHYGRFASEAAPPLTPDLDRTPVYPLFLAAMFGLGGHRPWLAALVQLALGSLTAAAAFLLARELRLPAAAGILAGLAVALDPVSAMTASRLLTETIFTLLVVAGAWMLARAWRTLRWRWAAAAALALALATLARPIAQALPLALLPLFAVAARRAGWRATLGGAALFIVLFAIPTAAWAARNQRASGIFTLSTISDTNLIYYRARAVLADVAGISQDEAWARLQAQVDAETQARGLSPTERVALQRRIALDIFRAHPLPTALMLAKGAGRILADPGYTITCTMLDPASTAFDCFPGKSSMNEPGLLGRAAGRLGQMSAAQVLALAWSATLLTLLYAAALAGAWGMHRRRQRLALALLLVMAAYLVGLAAGAEANSRFRVPALPFIAVLAGYGAHLAWGGLKRLRPARRIAALPQPGRFGGALPLQESLLGRGPQAPAPPAEPPSRSDV